MNLKPLSNKIVIKAEEAETVTKSGIVLPESASGDKSQIGTVVAVGPGKWNKKGKERIPMSVKNGDKVVFKQYGPDKVELNGNEYLIADEDDILAVIN